MNEELRIRPHRLMEEKTKTVGIAQELKNVVGALDLSVATTSWQGTSHSSSSKFFTILLIVGCETCRVSLAFVKLRCLATSKK